MKKKLYMTFGTCGCCRLNEGRTYLKAQQFVTRRWICGIKGGI